MIALMRSGGMMAHWREAMTQPKTSIWRPQQFYTGAVGATPVEKTAKGAEDAADAQTTVLDNIIRVPASDPASVPGKTEVLSNIVETDEVEALRSALRIDLATEKTPVAVTVSEASSDTESTLSSRCTSQIPSDTESIPSSPLPTKDTLKTKIPAAALEALEE
ncbi:MAG: hypothetical protein Q9191_000425 [Dirinaria sp. TL-2023a]